MDFRSVLSIAPLLCRMKSEQWKPADELLALQEERLLALVRYASENIPFYRSRLSAIRSICDLASLPLLEKKDVRDAASFIGRKPGKLIELKTSGSSGMPLRVYYDQREIDYMFALRYHLYTEAGLGPLDLQGFVSFRDRPPTLLQRMGFFRCLYLSFLDDDRKNVETLKGKGASALISCPSVLLRLADANSRNGIGFSPRLAFSTGEVLGRKSRAAITRSLGCRLYDRYGTIETGSVAWECQKGGMHVHSDSMIVEVVDGRGAPLPQGRTGDLVLTPLWRRSMPFIRYRIGDRGSLGTCSCGRGSPVLKTLEGRDNGFLTLPSGRLMISDYIGGKLRFASGVLQFQAIQETRGRLRILIVPEHGAAPDRKAIAEAVRSTLPEPMEIDVELTGRIPLSSMGKLRDFVSKVRPAG